MSPSHVAYFCLAVLYGVMFCGYIPWFIFTKLRAEQVTWCHCHGQLLRQVVAWSLELRVNACCLQVHIEKLERAWEMYISDGVVNWKRAEHRPSYTQHSWSSASVLQHRRHLETKVITDEHIAARIRGQALDEMRFSLLSNKYSTSVASWWFGWELFRKVS